MTGHHRHRAELAHGARIAEQHAYRTPHLMFGSVTRKKVCRPEAPSEIAASSSWVPCSCIKGISARATNGKVTKLVASAMPGSANSTWILWLCSQGPQ